MPAGMHHAKSTEIQPQRQRSEPIGNFLLQRRPFDDVQEGLMLRPVPRLVVIPQEAPGPVRIRSYPGNRVELMITENAARSTGLHHSPHQSDGLELLRSAVDQVADKYGGALGVPENGARLRIAEDGQEGCKLVKFTVDIAYDIKTHFAALPPAALDGIRCMRLGTSIAVRLPRLRAPDDEQNPSDDGNEPKQLKPSAPVRVVEPPRCHRDARQQGREGKSRRQAIAHGSKNRCRNEREQDPPPKLRSRRTTIKHRIFVEANLDRLAKCHRSAGRHGRPLPRVRVLEHLNASLVRQYYVRRGRNAQFRFYPAADRRGTSAVAGSPIHGCRTR